MDIATEVSYENYDVIFVGSNIVIDQPRSKGLSSLPPRIWVVEKSAGRVGQQGGILSSSRPNVLEYPPTLRFWMDRWSRDQPQPGSLSQRLREAENRDPGNEVGYRPHFGKFKLARIMK